jgi:hypothetical protein
MNQSFGHKVDKYALIYTAADEIIRHMNDVEDRPSKYQAFHLLHIEKAATFIKFVESVCVIPGGESLLRDDIYALWEAVNKGYHVWERAQKIHIEKPEDVVYRISGGVEWDRPAKQIIEVVEKYKRDISGKYESITAPF